MKKTLLLAASALLFAAACKPTQNPNPDVVEKMSDCLEKKWNYAASNLDIGTKDKPCPELSIVLKGQIAALAPDGKLQITETIAKDLELLQSGFSVNGKAYTGILFGVIQGEKGKLDTLLECHFDKGTPYGMLYVRAGDGSEHNISKQKVEPIKPDPIIRPYFPDAVKKPIIYLYPEKTTEVSLKVDFKGKLTHTYPQYPADGWRVLAHTDGRLQDKRTGKDYYSLFWEGESAYQYDMSRGFVVKGSEVAEFLDEALEKLGLNRREAGEFITFWLPEMEQNEYNLVHFSTTEYQKQALLQVEPKVDTEIRVFMVYQPLKKPIIVAPQTLRAPARKGFTLVEWGGKRQDAPAQ